MPSDLFTDGRSDVPTLHGGSLLAAAVLGTLLVAVLSRVTRYGLTGRPSTTGEAVRDFPLRLVEFSYFPLYAGQARVPADGSTWPALLAPWPALLAADLLVVIAVAYVALRLVGLVWPFGTPGRVFAEMSVLPDGPARPLATWTCPAVVAADIATPDTALLFARVHRLSVEVLTAAVTALDPQPVPVTAPALLAPVVLALLSTYLLAVVTVVPARLALAAADTGETRDRTHV